MVEGLAGARHGGCAGELAESGEGEAEEEGDVWGEGWEGCWDGGDGEREPGWKLEIQLETGVGGQQTVPDK